MRSTNPTKNATLTAYGLFLDGPTGNATIEVYTGAPPVSVGSPPGGTLIGILTFSRPSMLTPSGGTITASAISSETSALDDGTIGCFVIKNSSGTICNDGTITLVGGGGDLEFDEVDAEEGDTIAISSLSITF